MINKNKRTGKTMTQVGDSKNKVNNIKVKI